MRGIKALRDRLGNPAGFTLLEVVVAVGILTVALGMIGGGFFQAISFQGTFADDAVATKDLRHAGSWFAGDALNARAAVDASGSPLVCDQGATSVTLSWIDTKDVTHSATYRVTGGSLERAFDGAVNTMARRVVPNSARFTLCGKLLTLDLEVDAEPGARERMVLQTYLRKLR